MNAEHLKVVSSPKLSSATMLLALTGWMDGGLVSSGTVRRLMDGSNAREIAHIDPDPFYIYNFPGSMDIAAVFRPHVEYKEGVITDLRMPTNEFHCDPAANLVFFIGQEPNLRWQAFADCIFTLAKQVGVSRIVFIGSFGGAVPHTREPRLYGSISDDRLRPTLVEHGVQLSDYEGPCGFSTLLLAQAPAQGIEMLSLVAEIPGYLQGINPLSIEAVTRRLSRLLNLPVDLNSLRAASNDWEVEVSEAVAKDDKMAATVRKLEEEYDNQLIGVVSEDDDAQEEDEQEEEP